MYDNKHVVETLQTSNIRKSNSIVVERDIVALFKRRAYCT